MNVKFTHLNNMMNIWRIFGRVRIFMWYK